MSKRFYVLTTSGSQKLPVTNTTYATNESLDSNNDFSNSQFVISFKDANGDSVTPTAGTITPVMSPIEGQIMSPGDGSQVINATEVLAAGDGVAAYTIPTFSGIANQGFITFAGITGADHAVAFFWKT